MRLFGPREQCNNENKFTYVIFLHGVQTDVVQYVPESKSFRLVSTPLRIMTAAACTQ